MCLFFFFFNDTATTEIYTLSLHDALPISSNAPRHAQCGALDWGLGYPTKPARQIGLGPDSKQRPADTSYDWLPLKEYKAGRRKDRKSTRLNSSHANISYAVFCLKKKKNKQ